MGCQREDEVASVRSLTARAMMTFDNETLEIFVSSAIGLIARA